MGSQQSAAAYAPKVQQLLVDTIDGGTYGKTVKLDITGVSTIGEAKKRLERITGVPIEKQTLLLGFRELKAFEPLPTDKKITLVRSNQTVRKNLKSDHGFHQKMVKHNWRQECDTQQNTNSLIATGWI